MRLPRLRRSRSGPGIDEISEQYAVSCLDLRAHRIGRMPGVVADREGIAGIGRELHLRASWAACRPAAAHGRSCRCAWRVVARQVELDRDALPVRVGMRLDAVARNVAGQDRDRIHADLGEAAPNRRSRPDASARTKASLTCSEQSARPTMSQTRALLRRQMADVFRETDRSSPALGAVPGRGPWRGRASAGNLPRPAWRSASSRRRRREIRCPNTR